jgi:hypothetical protein
MSLSLRASTVAAVERAALASGKTGSAFLADHVERRFGGPEAEPKSPDCAHPKAKLRNVGHSILCGECGGRVR